MGELAERARVGGRLLSEDDPSVGLWVPTHRPAHGTDTGTVCNGLRIFFLIRRKQAWRVEGRKGRQGR